MLFDKFGVREICDVVLRAKATQKIGNKTFYKHEPVCYFDTLKTSSLEGAATTVYAQGGRGNARLMAWDGERTVTFTMEDALISPASFMILSGAGLMEATTDKALYVHTTERVEKARFVSGSFQKATVEGKLDTVSTSGSDSQDDALFIPLNATPADDKDIDGDYIYVMGLNDKGNPISEPFIATIGSNGDKTGCIIHAHEGNNENKYREHTYAVTYTEDETTVNAIDILKKCPAVLVDFYTKKTSGAQQIEITADKFGGNYYLEASTLFRDTDGVDMPAEFIIPNCKIQSNFTFTMASSGDPSTFTFTIDAFPDYTRFDPTKKVLAAIQIIEDVVTDDGEVLADVRHETINIDGVKDATGCPVTDCELHGTTTTGGTQGGTVQPGSGS